MGLFRAFSDAMNEEFILGPRSIARHAADPDSLPDILAEQRARGLGSARRLREHAKRPEAPEDAGGGGLLPTLAAVGIGLAAGVLLSGRRAEDPHR